MLSDYSPTILKEKGKAAKFGECEIDDNLKNVLLDRGIEKLYEHQCEGIERVRKGENVVVVAPTASGKSEIYLIPVVEAALKGRRSLLVYPTKALSRDQHARFREFGLLGVRSDVYDGDTTQHFRGKIRRDLPHLLITNIDMLHFILMNNRKFGSFWEKLDYVVIDELHTYSGVLGSHVANILKRLKRVTEKIGNKKKPQFICSSATIGNAKQFAEELVGEPFSLIDTHTAPKGPVEHYIIFPEEESFTTASLKIAKEIGKKTLIFGNSHSVVERLGMMSQETDFPVQVYRSGLTPEKRTEIENEFKNGNGGVLATTSALELGMDIGSVEAVILAGFPGTITRARQRIGRAGRKGQKSYGIYLARENPLDLYYVENPEKYLHGLPENCYVNATNENIVREQLLASSRDIPLDEDELDEKEKDCSFELAEKEYMKKWEGHGLIPTKEGLKHLQKMSIRNAGENIRIYDIEKQRFIGHRDEHMALSELFEGAYYLHGGRRYICEQLDLQKKTAFVQQVRHPVQEYTTAQKNKDAEIIETIFTREAFGKELSFGKLHFIEEVYGYVIKDLYGGRTIGRKFFDEPLHYEFDTYGIWFDYENNTGDYFADGLHATEHVTIAMMPAVTGADPKELGGLSYPSGRVFVYDSIPDGNGVTKIVYGKFELIQEMGLDRLRKCKCESGCPKCILDPQCGNNNKHLNKGAAIEILQYLLEKKQN